MSKILKLLRNIAIYYATLLFILFAMSLLHNYICFKDSTLNIVLLIILIVYSFILGLFHGLKTSNKGIIIGLKLSLINTLIFYIFGGLLFSFRLTKEVIVYYLILNLVICLGSIIGVNKKN